MKELAVLSECCHKFHGEKCRITRMFELARQVPRIEPVNRGTKQRLPETVSWFDCSCIQPPPSAPIPDRSGPGVTTGHRVRCATSCWRHPLRERRVTLPFDSFATRTCLSRAPSQHVHAKEWRYVTRERSSMDGTKTCAWASERNGREKSTRSTVEGTRACKQSIRKGACEKARSFCGRAKTLCNVRNLSSFCAGRGYCVAAKVGQYLVPSNLPRLRGRGMLHATKHSLRKVCIESCKLNLSE